MQCLAIERAVHRVYLDYCDVIDSKQFDDLDRVLTADYRDTQGVVIDGLAPLVSGLRQNMGPGSTCGPTHHNVLNFRIDPIDDAHASAQVHFHAVHCGVGAMAGEFYTVWGQYDDRLVLTDVGWRITNRRYTNYVVDGDKAVIRRGEPQPTASIA
jgi:hypothetical protein